jgi:hypothetical protein
LRSSFCGPNVDLGTNRRESIGSKMHLFDIISEKAMESEDTLCFRWRYRGNLLGLEEDSEWRAEI